MDWLVDELATLDVRGRAGRGPSTTAGGVWQVRDSPFSRTASGGVGELPLGGDFDLGRAKNMMLAARAIGVGSCPATLHFGEQVRALLGVPSDRSCRFAVGFGFPDETTEPELRFQMKSVFGEGRKLVTEVVRHETFR